MDILHFQHARETSALAFRSRGVARRAPARSFRGSLAGARNFRVDLRPKRPDTARAAEVSAERLIASPDPTLDLAGSREPGDVIRGAKRERLDGHRGLTATGRDQAAAIAQKQVRDVVRPVVAIDY